ncbi:MAG: ABC transporter substrate-binding protein [Xanthobacteraceae bacterium]
MTRGLSLFVAMLFALLLVDAGAETQAQRQITLTDVAGRTVTVTVPVRHVVLGEGRQLNALALLHRDPVALVAGWLGDLKRLDAKTYELFRAANPAIDKIPLLGITNESTFSVEKALAVKPDVAIFSGGHGPSKRSAEAVRQFEAAGIPVVFIDFHDQPLKNSIKSIEILGKLLGAEEKAAAYSKLYQERLDRIANRLASANPKRPTVFIHMHARLWECCPSAGKGNLGDYITFAGGQNIAADVLPGATGQINLEYVIQRNPEIYIATGGAHAITKGLAIGTFVSEADARKALALIAGEKGISSLAAVANGRVYGLWHHFYNSPLNILAVEAFAKWFHPELFPDIDPDKTLAEINEKFLAVPFKGTYWVKLTP